MSTIAYIGMLVTAIVGAFLGLRVGHAMALKNRDPKAEDPRDQAIRELRAELRVAQKSVDIAKNEEDKAHSDIDNTKAELKKTLAALHDLEQKYETTKEFLSKESAEKQEAQDREDQFRIEADKLRNQVHELEMEANLTTGSNMLLGNEMADDSALEDANNTIEELRQQISMLKSMSDGSEQSTALQESAAEVASLRSKVARLEEQAEEVASMGISLQEKNRLENQIQTLTQQIKRGEQDQARLEETEARLSKAKSEVTQLREKLLEAETSSGRIAELEAELASTESTRAGIRQLQDELSAAQAANAKLREESQSLSASASQTESLQAQLNEAELEKQQLRKDMHKLQLIAKAAEKLKAELDRLRNLGAELKKSREEVAHLTNKRQAEKAEHAELESSMQEQLANERKTIEALEASVQELTGKLATATADEERNAAKLAASKDTEDSLQTLVDDYSSQMTDLRQQHEKNNELLAEQELELNQLRSENTAITDSRDALSDEIAKLKTELTAAVEQTAEIDALREQVQLAGDQATQIAELKSLLTEARSTQEELVASEELIEELQQDNEAKTAAIQAAEQQIEEANGALADARAEVAALQTTMDQNTHLQTELQELRDALAQAQAEQQELLGMRDQLEDLEQQRQQQNGKLSELEAELDNARADASAAKVAEIKTREELDAWQHEREELHTRTQHIQDNAANSIRISNEMVDRLQRQSVERDALRQENAELEATALAALTEAEDLRKELTQIEKSASKLDSERTDLVERLRNSIAENESLKRDISGNDNMAEENERLKAKLARIKESLEREKQLHAAAQKQNEAQLIKDEVTMPDISRPPVTADVQEASAEAPQSDDLKQIKGVGDVLQKKLRTLGIDSFKDICALGPDDYARAAELIPNLESRVKRDNWQSQAARLHQTKYNETIN